MERGGKHAGIRMSWLNVLLICAGLVIALFMVLSMYRSNKSMNEIVTVTQAYLNSQQTAGKLNGISSGMAEQALAFVQTGEPGTAFSYVGQMDTLNEDLDGYEAGTISSEAAEEYMFKAVTAYRERCATELRAMRLKADTLPKPAFEALPPYIRQAELSKEDQALSPEEKQAKALELLTSEEYASNGALISQAVDDSHRLASEQGQIRAKEISARAKSILSTQKILIFLFILIALLALVINWMLVIRPLNRSVNNLDRREQIPEEGSYEFRHLAKVYNEVLADNEKKTEALSYAATHDALTGMLNRAAFDEAYDELKAGQTGLVVADVDHFKLYNDEFGHDIGDRVLKTAADALRGHFRKEDIICRIGGDEFCILMPNTDHADGPKIKEKIREINEELARTGENLPPITISAGISFWNRPDKQSGLFKDADSALLEIKKTRDTCCAVYPEPFQKNQGAK